ncbi:MAG: hypothetical protein LIO94_05430, partial [Clostridiales bacterium]|nr:hypothetical protein [Clostridiales bacterium]
PPSGSSEEDTKSEQTKAEETSEKMGEDSLRLATESGQQREQLLLDGVKNKKRPELPEQWKEVLEEEQPEQMPEVPEEEETRRIPEEMPVMPEEEQPEQKPEVPIEVQPEQNPEEMPEMPEQAQPQEMQQKTSQQAAIDKPTETFRSPVQAQAVLDIESVINGKEKESAVAHSGRSCAETLLRGRQPYQPFRDDEFTDCVQIKLCDVLPLQQEKWQVGRSNFLQHGYYLYRHLLFGRAKNGAYILGVPGVRSQQEEYMAHLFGYDQFKLSRISSCGRKFGYWYRLLKEPERVS